MQIVDKSYFNNQNYINIPLSVNDPSGSVAPSNATALDNLCIKVEREILLNALGLELYNEFKALTLITIEDIGNERWKKFVQGEEYDGKVWLGLNYDDSLIAWKVFEQFVSDTNRRLSATGVTSVNAENATNQTPAYLIATANQTFTKQYQGEFLDSPIINGCFIDWYGCTEIEKSLYGYLMDRQVEFPEWDLTKFRIYETKNTFGL